MGRERDANRGVATYNRDPDELRLIEDKDHPRYDPRVELDLDQGLVESINVHGVIEPIVAFKDGPHVEVLDGRQRVRAAREVNRRRREQGAPTIKVSYVLRNITDDGAAVSIRNHANIRAEQSILEKARSVQHDMETLGKSLDQAASDRGKDIATVKSWLRLLDCVPVVQKAVEDGRITFTQATKLSRIERDKQADALKEIADRRGGSKAERKDAPPATRQKTKSGRPSTATVRKAAGTKFDSLTDRELAAWDAIKWAAGECSTDNLLRAYPGLRPAFEAKRDAPAEAEIAAAE